MLCPGHGVWQGNNLCGPKQVHQCVDIPHIFALQALSSLHIGLVFNSYDQALLYDALDPRLEATLTYPLL